MADNNNINLESGLQTVKQFTPRIENSLTPEMQEILRILEEEIKWAFEYVQGNLEQIVEITAGNPTYFANNNDAYKMLVKARMRLVEPHLKTITENPLIIAKIKTGKITTNEEFEEFLREKQGNNGEEANTEK